MQIFKCRISTLLVQAGLNPITLASFVNNLRADAYNIHYLQQRK